MLILSPGKNKELLCSKSKYNFTSVEYNLKVCEFLVNINNIFYLYRTEEWNRGDKGNRRKNGRVIKATRREGDWEKMRNEEDENRRKVKGLVTVPATN